MAYYNMFSGSGADLRRPAAAASSSGSTSSSPSAYLLAFLASGLLRLGASLLFLPRLREVRPVEEIGYRTLFFKVVFSVPTISLLYELIPFQTEGAGRVIGRQSQNP